VFLDDAVVERRHSGGDGVRGQRHGLGARRREEPHVLLHVAGGEAVRCAADALGPQGPGHPPWAEPSAGQHPPSAPQSGQQGPESAEKAPWWYVESRHAQ
jgi:hypothetical protein